MIKQIENKVTIKNLTTYDLDANRIIVEIQYNLGFKHYVCRWQQIYINLDEIFTDPVSQFWEADERRRNNLIETILYHEAINRMMKDACDDRLYQAWSFCEEYLTDDSKNIKITNSSLLRLMKLQAAIEEQYDLTDKMNEQIDKRLDENNL